LEEAMHKSKLGGLIIDCKTDDLDRPDGPTILRVRAAWKSFAEHATA
jgi:hypothetical protein